MRYNGDNELVVEGNEPRHTLSGTSQLEGFYVDISTLWTGVHLDGLTIDLQ